MKPDFNAEETASVQKDKRTINKMVREMAEYLPQEDPEKGIEIEYLLNKSKKYGIFGLEIFIY